MIKKTIGLPRFLTGLRLPALRKLFADHENSAMIAVFPPKSVRVALQALKIEGKEDMPHVTVIFLGKDLEDKTKQIVDAVTKVCAEHKQLSGRSIYRIRSGRSKKCVCASAPRLSIASH